MPLPINIRNLGGLAATLSGLRDKLYQPPSSTISGISENAWPNPGQPMTPVGPKGSGPMGFPLLWGQNLQYTPRPDATYTAAELQVLATYPLARICIDNTKDVIGQTKWEIQLRQAPGETRQQTSARRKRDERGDRNIVKLSRFFEYPTREHNWSEWTRILLERMLVTDDACALVRRNMGGDIAEIYPVLEGGDIARYVDENGFTPLPPSPAYSQLYGGLPKVNLTTEQLIYKPRNIVPRKNIISSYLYGLSPSESIAEELKIGIARLIYTMAFYEKGSVGNFIHVASSKVAPDKVEESVNVYNSQTSGHLDKRRQYTILQGFLEDGKDQILFPKEPSLADNFDELLIRKVAFAYGNSPQRLLRPMNRGSSQTSQSASQQEGMLPYINWVKGFTDYIIQRVLGYDKYEIVMDDITDNDPLKKAKVASTYVKEGLRTRNETRDSDGLDRFDDPMADKLTITTANGAVELGEYIVSGKGNNAPVGALPGGGDEGKFPNANKPAQGGDPSSQPQPTGQRVVTAKTAINGSGHKLVLRGE